MRSQSLWNKQIRNTYTGRTLQNILLLWQCAVWEIPLALNSWQGTEMLAPRFTEAPVHPLPALAWCKPVRYIQRPGVRIQSSQPELRKALSGHGLSAKTMPQDDPYVLVHGQRSVPRGKPCLVYAVPPVAEQVPFAFTGPGKEYLASLEARAVHSGGCLTQTRKAHLRWSFASSIRTSLWRLLISQ